VAEQSGIVAEEVPVALSYNGRPHAVMMATPADLEDFAVGFTLSEQIVTGEGELPSIEVVRHAQGIELQLQIASRAAERLAERPRNLVGRTSCGLCGVELIADALRDISPVMKGSPISGDAIVRAGAALPSMQLWNQETGAMHAAAWVTARGDISLVREDVGRHNALDKVIGAMTRAAVSPENGFIIITSRASYELVQKTAVAGIQLLVAVSRPTGLAIKLAEATGVALVGLLRAETFNIYSDPQHIMQMPDTSYSTPDATGATHD
jgi:formate dehydrogenase accessory protein FdhD